MIMKKICQKQIRLGLEVSMVKFYDTNSLLDLQEKIFEDRFLISSITLKEIEDIKTSSQKDSEIKYKARNIARLLDENGEKYDVIVVDSSFDDVLGQFNLPMSPDNYIAACAYICNTKEPTLFVSNDINIKNIARKVFGLDVESAYDDRDEQYKGYKVVELPDEDLAALYEDLHNNQFDCLVNEYLVVNNLHGETVDRLKWNGEQYTPLSSKNFKSRMFGTIKPFDNIQRCAFDSLQTNDITVLYGKAGSGKTTIPLSYMMQMLETQKIKTCHIIYHYEPLKGAKTLGFEKGSHLEKTLNTGALGNILSSKIGDLQTVENMIASGALNIIPTANIRGVEFGSEDAVFVTEAQNINVYTLKTIIQRCKDGCRQIYEGDILEQSDINCTQLGIDRMIEVFKGHKKFGVVKLKNNYRSEFCELADLM